MKPKPINQQTRKKAKTTESVDWVDPIMKSIIAQYPSMTADKALTCASIAYLRSTKKPGSEFEIDKLTQIVVAKYAAAFVIKCGGKFFTEGREGAIAQKLLQVWSVPDNELEVAKLMKLFKQVKQAYEEADDVLSETAKKKGTKTKTNRG